MLEVWFAGESSLVVEFQRYARTCEKPLDEHESHVQFADRGVRTLEGKPLLDLRKHICTGNGEKGLAHQTCSSSLQFVCRTVIVLYTVSVSRIGIAT